MSPEWGRAQKEIAGKPSMSLRVTHRFPQDFLPGIIQGKRWPFGEASFYRIQAAVRGFVMVAIDAVLHSVAAA